MKTLNQAITEIVNERVSMFKGNQTRAAKSLGMCRNSLRKYMNKYEFNKFTHKKNKIKAKIESLTKELNKL